MGPDQTRAGNPACGIAGLLDPPHRLPATVEATLLHEGIGGVLFLETVTRWEPHRNLAFTIRASTAPIPPATLDKHVTITNNRKPRNPTPLKQAPVIHALPHLGGIQQDILPVIKRQCEQPYRIW